MKWVKRFKNSELNVVLEGNIAPEKAIRAAELSFEKYCSVSITLEKSVIVNYEITLNSVKIV